MSNINKIKVSGQTYSIQDENATKTVELTQAQYDALAVKDPNTFYIITDATGGDLSNYYTKSEADDLLDAKLDVSAYTPTDLSNYYTKSETSGATEISTALASKADTATTYTKSEVDNAITAATSTKQDQLVSGTNIKTINNESILGSGNITIEGGGGGKAVSAGTNISITTGETADTINCTLNLENGTNSQSGGIKLKSNGAGNSVSGRDACAFGGGNRVGGINSFVTGYYNTGNTNNAFIGGYSNKTTNDTEALFGTYALSNGSRTGDFYGDSGCTMFAVGNGEWRSQTRHNAFEIRQNGDIYIADTNDTSTTNYYQKPMIKLQDALGGTVDTEITSASTNPVTSAAIYNQFGGLKLVKLTQAQYDALSTKDSNTLYIING